MISNTGCLVEDRGRGAAIRRSWLLCLLLTAGLAGCSGWGEPSGDAAGSRGTVASLGDVRLSYESFERYLDGNAGVDREALAQQHEIMSSLLDQFLEEEILLQAGAEIGVAVSEAEIDAYLAEIGVRGDADGELAEDEPIDPETFRSAVRRGLLLQKVKDEVVLSKVEVTDGEVDDFLKKHPDMVRKSPTLVLRHILVEDREAAERLRKTVASAPDRFEELARQHSAAPDGGQAKSYRAEQLPQSLVEPLLALDNGEISKVIELAQRFMIFQLVRKDESTPRNQDEVRGRVRLELYQEKVDQVLAQYIADLKKDTAIHVNRSNLPFRYVGEHGY